MLLKTNERNRQVTTQNEEWDSFRSTPQVQTDDDSVDMPVTESKFNKLKNIDSR